jgi:hypothetical protein
MSVANGLCFGCGMGEAGSSRRGGASASGPVRLEGLDGRGDPGRETANGEGDRRPNELRPGSQAESYRAAPVLRNCLSSCAHSGCGETPKKHRRVRWLISSPEATVAWQNMG